MKASYDVYYTPVVNIPLEVKNPHRLNKEETEKLVELAKDEMYRYFDEKICGDNITAIELYSIQESKEKETFTKETIYDGGIQYFPFYANDTITEDMLKIKCWKPTVQVSGKTVLWEKSFEVYGKTYHCSLCKESNTRSDGWHVQVDNDRFESVGGMDVTLFSRIEMFLELLGKD